MIETFCSKLESGFHKWIWMAMPGACHRERRQQSRRFGNDPSNTAAVCVFPRPHEIKRPTMTQLVKTWLKEPSQVVPKECPAGCPARYPIYMVF